MKYLVMKQTVVAGRGSFVYQGRDVDTGQTIGKNYWSDGVVWLGEICDEISVENAQKKKDVAQWKQETNRHKRHKG